MKDDKIDKELQWILDNFVYTIETNLNIEYLFQRKRAIRKIKRLYELLGVDEKGKNE